MIKTMMIMFAVAMSFATAASAEVRITDDHGGLVDDYIAKYRVLNRIGERVVIDGRCLSACTLLTGIIPRNRVCVTARAILGFHMAWKYNDADVPVPARQGTRELMSVYPAFIRNWIRRHGGLTPRLILLRGRKLRAMYRTCK